MRDAQQQPRVGVGEGKLVVHEAVALRRRLQLQPRGRRVLAGAAKLAERRAHRVQKHVAEAEADGEAKMGIPFSAVTRKIKRPGWKQPESKHGAHGASTESPWRASLAGCYWVVAFERSECRRALLELLLIAD